ncbi:MAG: ATP-binding cassette domain-containing protein [Bacteroidetes bacterium]|nr:ATP-binding cassette domain-containing protein [Bacteroidota bacterium]
MNKFSLTLKDVTKIFGRRLIFDKINYSFESGKVYGLAGPNGSGKSTLSKIISGLLEPTHGKVIHESDGSIIIPEKLHDYLGFVSPYLVLYDEFTAEENLFHFSKIRGTQYDSEKAKSMLEEFNIYNRRTDLLKAYSSGMKQRMKFIFALLHSPRLLLLDEPTSNLDNPGKEKVYEIINREAENNLVIIASNEDSDLALCKEIVNIEDFKNNGNIK